MTEAQFLKKWYALTNMKFTGDIAKQCHYSQAIFFAYRIGQKQALAENTDFATLIPSQLSQSDRQVLNEIKEAYDVI